MCQVRLWCCWAGRYWILAGSKCQCETTLFCWSTICEKQILSGLFRTKQSGGRNLHGRKTLALPRFYDFRMNKNA